MQVNVLVTATELMLKNTCKMSITKINSETADKQQCIVCFDLFGSLQCSVSELKIDKIMEDRERDKLIRALYVESEFD